MFALILLALCVSTFFNSVISECANACNGHGRCTSYDMCICNRNWQSADCSERTCAFGLAHVDTSKGDLNQDGVIEGPDSLIIENSYTYPYGTTEGFPQMEDSDLQVLTDSAHYYMECSNKGTCDRSSGECKCYDGYDGISCQRASCPGYPTSCSGHGVCKTIKQLAFSDNENVYSLWDKDKTMGCECDSGYYGPDCSLRQCKVGVDPLYLDDVATIKYSTFDFATLTVNIPFPGTTGAYSSGNLFHDNTPLKGVGHWAIRFFDSFGEDWVTEPLPADASCGQVLDALYALPNDVIPPSSLMCSKIYITNGKMQTVLGSMNGGFYDSLSTTKHPYRIVEKLAFWEAYEGANYGELNPYNSALAFTGSNTTSTVDQKNVKTIGGDIYRIHFYGNPGALKVPEIVVMLDGKRPSLVSDYGKVVTKVWTDGQQGEDNDYFADHCDGVTALIAQHDWESTPYQPMTFHGRLVSYLTGMTTAEKNLLKKCLANADFDTTNNNDVYNWDRGTKYYPHLIKLVRTVTTYTDGGYYAALWYDTTQTWDMTGTEGTFRLLNPFKTPDNFKTDRYDIYTTTGTLALTSQKSEATFGFGSQYIYMTNTTYDTDGYNTTEAASQRATGAGLNAFDGDLSCEIGNNNGYRLATGAKYIYHCLNKTDIITLLSWETPYLNPPNINLYTINRLYTQQYTNSVVSKFGTAAFGGTSNVRSQHKKFTAHIHPTDNYEMHYMTHMITVDTPTNWAVTVDPVTPWHGSSSSANAPFLVYKFFPASASTYNYVAECSNRGLCDTDSGVCKCFPGYTSDDCSEQAALSV